jgi:hypothetical protein
MKKFAILFVAMAFAATAYGAPFSDVPRTHWAYDAIQKAVAHGILQGYDGKFDGKRLLNRYQMAVIVAKMLDKVQGGGAVAAPDGDLKKMIANLEALTIEFADELALLNVKVSTLEDTVKELQAGKPMKHVAAPTGEIGFTAFASFALVSTDDYTGGGARTRYTAVSPDQMFFTMPQVSMGVDKEVNPGVFFHAQFDYASDVNTPIGGNVNINEAYFFLDEMFGDIGGKMGAFAVPGSMEHNGPFRTCNLTITPSAINTAFEQIRPYGLELQKTKDVQPDDIMWKFGIVSGTDLSTGGAVGRIGLFNDSPAASYNAIERDDGIGFYIMIGKKPQRTGQFGWNLSYFTNGGDDSATTGASAEVSLFNLGFEWSNDDILILAQYLSGDDEYGATQNEFDSFYFLVNYKVDEKQSVTLRYDDFTANNTAGVAYDDGNAITFAYNRKVTDNSIMQFEYLMVDEDAVAPASDEDDDLWQFRYKVHF